MLAAIRPCVPRDCSFATVKQATKKGKKKDEGGQKLAVKIIIKTALNSEDKAALETEVAVMEKLKHENIVELVEVFDCTVRQGEGGEGGGGVDSLYFVRAIASLVQHRRGDRRGGD